MSPSIVSGLWHRSCQRTAEIPSNKHLCLLFPVFVRHNLAAKLVTNTQRLLLEYLGGRESKKYNAIYNFHARTMGNYWHANIGFVRRYAVLNGISGEESVRRLVPFFLKKVIGTDQWSLIWFDQDMEIPTAAVNATP